MASERTAADQLAAAAEDRAGGVAAGQDGVPLVAPVMKHLRADDYRIMPWKNGGGTTTEIAVWPPDAGLDDFLWRVSMARVESAGPFSIFPGVDRSLSIIEGSGLFLHLQGRIPIGLTGQSDPLSFPADLPASASLVGGPITDFNVMSRRGQVEHSLEVAEVDGGLEVEVEAPQALLFCARGSVRVTSSEGEANLAAWDALLLDPAPRRVSLRAERPAHLCLAEFCPALARAPEA